MKDTENKGVRAPDDSDLPLKDDLRNVIEGMGPNTPSTKQTTVSDTITTTTDSKVQELYLNNHVLIESGPEHDTTPNTPKDISGYTSIPTDTAEVYHHQKHHYPQPHGQQYHENLRHSHQFQKKPLIAIKARLEDVRNDRILKLQRKLVSQSSAREYHRGELKTGAPMEYKISRRTSRHSRSPREASMKPPRYQKESSNTIDRIQNFLGFGVKPRDGIHREAMDLYRINILQPKNDNSAPRKVIFDLVENLPKPDQMTVATNTFFHTKDVALNFSPQQTDHMIQCGCGNDTINGRVLMQQQPRTQYKTFYESRNKSEHPIRDSKSSDKTNLDDLTRVDVYYFDHGNAAYYHTTDSPPIILSEILADKTEAYTTKFWAEVYGTIHIGCSFFTSFVLQTFRFFFQSLLRPLTVGLIQLLSDYFLKPLLATLFNAIVQPPLIFTYNVLSSIRDICDPIAEGIGYFIREVAVIFRAIRLIEVKTSNKERCCDFCHGKLREGTHECRRCNNGPDEEEMRFQYRDTEEDHEEDCFCGCNYLNEPTAA